MDTQKITVKVKDKFLTDMRGQTLINGGGQFHIEMDGTARVPIEVASECYNHPNYEVPDAAEQVLVQKFLTSSVVTENGNYDAGKPVRVECADYAGVGTAAPDGSIVRFSPEGFATCGIKTAEELQKIVPSLQIHSLDKSETTAANKAAKTQADETDTDSDTDDDNFEDEEDNDADTDASDDDSESDIEDDEAVLKAKHVATAAKAAATRKKNAAAKSGK